MAHPKMVISAPRNHNVTKRMERHEQALCAGSRTLTLDLVNEHMITVGEMQEAGMNMQQVIYAWGSPPGMTNLSFHNVTKAALEAIHRALQNKVLRHRFSQLDWFDVGLSIQDMVRLRDLSIDVFITFGVTAARIVDHDGNNYGENWAHYFGWTPAEWRRIGFGNEDHRVAEKRQLQRGDSKFGMQAARKRWGPEKERDIVAPFHALQ